MSGNQGMSADEIALLEEGLDEQGNPKELETERENARVLSLNTDGAKPQGDDTDDDGEAAAAAAPPAAATAPAVAAEEPVKEPLAAAPAEASEKTSESAASAEAPSAAPTPAPEPTGFVPQFQAEVPADADEQITRLAGEKDAAFKKLMDGEIPADTYQEAARRVDSAIRDLENKKLTASIFEQANQQASQQAAETEWKRQENRLLAQFKDEGIDYRGKPALLAAFNTNLRALGTDAANESKDAAWFLNEAHRLTKGDLGLAAAAKAAAPAPAAPRGVDKSTIPPTLSNVPPSVDPTVSGDEFSHLTNLTGNDLELAVAKMTPEQLERYLDR